MHQEYYYIQVDKDGSKVFTTGPMDNPGAARAAFAQLLGRLPVTAGFSLTVTKVLPVTHDCTADFLRAVR